MKKLNLIGMVIIVVLLLSACGSGGGTNNKAAVSNASTVSQLLADAAQDDSVSITDAGLPTDDAASPVVADATLQTPRLSDIDISSAEADVDLTLLSGTMVYSQVSQMMYEPEDFIGKTVKMEGAFSIFEGDERNYYACIIQDATACCANGIEFVWSGEHIYPEDYPELGTDITVIGTFDLYEENGFMYSQLADATVIFYHRIRKILAISGNGAHTLPRRGSVCALCEAQPGHPSDRAFVAFAPSRGRAPASAYALYPHRWRGWPKRRKPFQIIVDRLECSCCN